MTDSMQEDSPATSSVPSCVVPSGAPYASWAAPEQPPQEPGAGRTGAAAVGHFLFWSLLIVAAVLLVSIAVQLVVVVVGTIAIVVRDGLGSDSDVASGDLLAIMIVSQLAEIAIFVPWWKRVRHRGIGIAHGNGETTRGRGGEGVKSLALALLAIALIGVGLQLLISLALNIILPLFPDILHEYNELMETGGTEEFALFPVLSVAVLAPISEELAVRGVALQFALRGVCSTWDKRLATGAYPKIEVGPARFWAANVIQALAFGILHLNITQGLYAFAIGMVLGWMFGRTGKLRYGIALHLAINLSSYFVEGFYNAFGLFGDWGIVVLPTICLVVGLRLFAKVVPADSGAALSHVKRSCAPEESAL